MNTTQAYCSTYCIADNGHGDVFIVLNCILVMLVVILSLYKLCYKEENRCVFWTNTINLKISSDGVSPRCVVFILQAREFIDHGLCAGILPSYPLLH